MRLGRLTLERRPTRLAGLIETALDNTRPYVEANGRQISVRLPINDIEVDADPLRLAQVLNNLITNSVKYTPAGGQISVSAELVDGEAVISVADNGIGIAASEISGVFEMFTQGPQTPDRVNSGLGIGLALARSIMNLHGGWIEAESAGIGQGSRFRFGLPVLRTLPARSLHDAASQAEQGKAAQADDQRAPAVSASVLVADDNQDAAWAIARLLSLAGHRTRIATDGTSALELAFEERPDVMLVDIGMPDIDGRDVARRIRATPWGAGVLLIAATGWGREDDVRRSLEAGFDAHLTKPIEIAGLHQLIDDRLASSERAVPRQA
jgi:two-component system CheB/CheR fusion protein